MTAPVSRCFKGWPFYHFLYKHSFGDISMWLCCVFKKIHRPHATLLKWVSYLNRHINILIINDDTNGETIFFWHWRLKRTIQAVNAFYQLSCVDGAICGSSWRRGTWKWALWCPRDLTWRTFYFFFILLLLLFVFLPSLGPLLWHMEVPRLGVQSEL